MLFLELSSTVKARTFPALARLPGQVRVAADGGWIAVARLDVSLATAEDVKPYRNKACPGSVPLIMMEEGGRLAPEAAERMALWDSEWIAFALGCGPDGPEDTDGPNTRTLLANGKRLLWNVAGGGQVADGDLLVIQLQSAMAGGVVPCQLVAVRGVGCPWFDVQQVSARVYALSEQGHYERAISYLVIGEERAALIDTGMGIADIEREVRRLTDKPIVVLNTHSHYDHVGDNHRFADVAMFITSASLAVAQQGFSHEQLVNLGAAKPEAFYRPWSIPQGFDLSSYCILPFTVTHHLRDGQTIDLGGRSLQVLHTPGHSADSVCFLDPVDRRLFVGDTFYPGTLYAHLPDSSMDDYLASMRRLAGLVEQLDAIHPAHNLATLPPEILKRFLEALEDVQSGRAIGRMANADPLGSDQRLRYYEWPHFSLLVPEKGR